MTEVLRDDLRCCWRAAYLATHHEDARILVATFSDPLAKSLQAKLQLLLGKRPKLYERIDVCSMDALGKRLYERRIGKVQLASNELVRELLTDVAQEVEGHKFTDRFNWSEWNEVVDAWHPERTRPLETASLAVSKAAQQLLWLGQCHRR